MVEMFRNSGQNILEIQSEHSGKAVLVDKSPEHNQPGPILHAAGRKVVDILSQRTKKRLRLASHLQFRDVNE